MKTITIIAEQLSERALAAVTPSTGVVSVRVGTYRPAPRNDAVQRYQDFRNPTRFAPAVRIELLVDDAAVDSVFDAVSFAYGAGVFSDAEMWADTAALALSA